MKEYKEFKDISPEIAAIAANYQYHRPPDFIVDIQDKLTKLQRQILEWLDLLQPQTTSAADSRSISALLQMLLTAAGVIAFLAVVYLVAKRIGNRARSAAVATRGAESVEKISDAHGLKLEAQSQAARGDYRAACRSLYLCLLQMLHEKDIAPFAPTKTNYEYRYILGNHPELKTGFTQLAQVVEFVWFGTREADASDYLTCNDLLSRLEATVADISEKREPAGEGGEPA